MSNKPWKFAPAYLTVNNGDNEEEFFDIKLYKRVNPYFKRDYIRSVSEEICPVIDQAIDDIRDSGIPEDLIAETLLERVGLHDIIVLVDFINPFPITPSLAKKLTELNMFNHMLKYSVKKEPTLQDYRLDSKYYKGFDWVSAIKNNYKFIIAQTNA